MDGLQVAKITIFNRGIADTTENLQFEISAWTLQEM